jgi:cob(I)alamin adenosyltransferase
MIHIYTGDGKGKTTAAFGLAIRARGHGKKVLIFQFLKGRTPQSGEIKIAREAGIKVIKFRDQVSPLFDPQVNENTLRERIRKDIERTKKEISSDQYDLIIFDEFNNLLSAGYADMADAKALINICPDNADIVFTGRGAPSELIRMADYVTEMKMKKHPYVKGIKGRRGIEF